MSNAMLEHVNVTVSSPEQTAALMCQLFGWHIRWQGESMMGGRTVHVGNDDSFVALYSPHETTNSYATRASLNHIGVVVDDLDNAEHRVLAAGFATHNHGEYEPGRRFYFNDHDGIEFEVVNYPEVSASN